MRILEKLGKLTDAENVVLTIGSFDGVHRGHAKIISRVTSLAKEINGTSVVITFHPHPRSVIYPKDKAVYLLNTLEEKKARIEALKVDYLVIVPFTVEFSQQNPREYIEKFLIDLYNPKYIVIGYDHRFGLNREGDINLLKRYEAKDHFKIIEIPKQELEEVTISSTKIRNSLKEGYIEKANQLLNSPYTISGIVDKGDRIGTKIDYPTANIDWKEKNKLIPKQGIYAAVAVVNDERHNAMLYIGNRPSINDRTKEVVEVHLLDFKGNIYDEAISVELLSYIRPDKKLPDLKALKSQIALDEVSIRNFFDNPKNHIEEATDINILILNYNGTEYLESFLPSVSYSSTHNFLTTIIDNQSTDDSIKMLEDWFPEIAIIPLSKNHGFAGGYNKGTVDLKEKYFVLLNSDVKVTENWLDPIIAYMDEHPDVAIVQPKILSLEETDHFEYAGASGGYLDSLGYPYCRGRILEVCEKDQGQYDDTTEVFWASGAACVIRSDVWKNLEGFDADYFAHMEEIDLCWRIKSAGYKVVVLPSSTVYHLGGGTLSYNNPKKVFLNFKNNLTTLLKNETTSKLLWLFPLRLILDGLAGIMFLAKLKPKNCLAIIKAHLSVYGNFAAIIRKRKHHNKLIEKYRVGTANKVGHAALSIISQYYIRGKRKFSDLK
jgi:riboflavin kinase/FMN adenylyltransferase